MTANSDIKTSDIFGGGYSDFLKFKGRYRVCKGSRASKKSKTTALNIVFRMMKYPMANTLVVRKVYRTLKDSCFSDIKWAIRRWCDAYNLDASRWEVKESPLEITYNNYNGQKQKILFRGLDDPMKITSITTEYGYLCWLWVEEAYEIGSLADFEMLDESIRGAIPQNTGLFKQITLTFNPWNEHHWLKERFFDNPDSETLAMSTNYMCNEWLDESDLVKFNLMKEQNPRRYQVAGLGEWGVADGLVYENIEQSAFDIDEIRQLSSVKSVFGLDFGYTNDPTALFCGLIDETAKTLWVFDEIYEKGMSNERIYEAVLHAGYAKEKITADSAEPKSIDRLRELGLQRIKKARKGKDSINAGIDYLQDYHIIIHPKCVNFITEITTYSWKKDPKTGFSINVPEDDYNHLMDAMRYAVEDISKGDAFSFS